MPDFAKEFGQHDSGWQADALTHGGHQALATVDIIIGCCHFKQAIGEEHDKIVHGHRTLAVLVLGVIKQAKRRSAAAFRTYRLKVASEAMQQQRFRMGCVREENSRARGIGDEVKTGDEERALGVLQNRTQVAVQFW